MVVSKEDLLKAIAEVIGDSTEDNAIALLENATDTIEDMSKSVADAGDWKKKYEENDAMWRNKYKERFLGGEEIQQPEIHVEEEDSEAEKVTIDDLFE